ncbi:MAG: Lar family restriction alleviation protein [Gammaproteobacteria bacterium]
MNDETEKLKNCPCCGGAAEVCEDEWGSMVRCTDCGLNNGGEYAPNIPTDDRIKSWNMRTNELEA